MKLMMVFGSAPTEAEQMLAKVYLGTSLPVCTQLPAYGVTILSLTQPTFGEQEVEDLYIVFPENIHVEKQKIYYVNAVVSKWQANNSERNATNAMYLGVNVANWVNNCLFMLMYAGEEMMEVRMVKTIVDEGSPAVVQLCNYNQY